MIRRRERRGGGILSGFDGGSCLLYVWIPVAGVHYHHSITNYSATDYISMPPLGAYVPLDKMLNMYVPLLVTLIKVCVCMSLSF
jgi:hypothetical protein